MGENVFKPGDRCGDHEVIRLLGSGGFAEVYEVRDPTGARRALKTLATEAEQRPKLRARLAQEGTALAMIDHPNVVRVHEAGFHEDRVYLVLELVEGGTLRDAMLAAGGRIAPRPLTIWAHQICEGVEAAHAAGVVHRDLKPENIVLTADDRAKVIDFGIAKLSSDGVKTTSDQRVGTAMYMAPEHLQREVVDPRIDVYSMGLVLYEALTGVHPTVPEPTTLAEVCARQIHHRPRPLVIAAPWVPADLAATVDRAIEKDPARRFPSMRALSDALLGALARMPHDGPAVPWSQGGPALPLARTAVLLLGTSSGPVPDAATVEVSGSGPRDTTAPDVTEDRQASLPDAMPDERAPAAPRPAPRRAAPSKAEIAVAALALALGITGGVAAAVMIRRAWIAPPAAASPPRR